MASFENPSALSTNFPALGQSSSNREPAPKTVETSSWPRFLVMESTDNIKSLSSLSPFIVEKAMKGISGEIKSVKKLSTGTLLIEATRELQVTNLLNLTSFAGVPIKVSPHRSLNSCKGVITDRDLAKLDPDELVEELKAQNVTQARVITQNRGGIRSKTNSIILTFAAPSLPSNINVCYQRLQVRPFIPNPLRCFKCQKYGHHQSTCKHAEVCPKCSLTSHGDEPCTGPVNCVNCGGDHPAYVSACPVWKREKDICRVKVTSNVSYPEARKLAQAMPATTNTLTYANITKSTSKTTRSVSTQTDVTGCTCATNTTATVSRVCEASSQTLDITSNIEKTTTVVAKGRARTMSDPSLNIRVVGSVTHAQKEADASPDNKKQRVDAAANAAAGTGSRASGEGSGRSGGGHKTRPPYVTIKPP